MIKSKKRKSTLPKKLCAFFVIGILLLFNNTIYANNNTLKVKSTMETNQSTRIVKGTVKDSSGDPLIGVTVVIEGTQVGTITDLDGKYSLNVPNEKSKLIFSYIGYKTTILTANKTVIDLVMSEESTMMDEIVVVGYGTQRKENLTGAVASVDVGKTLSSRPIADIGRGLQGAVAGLSVSIPSGEIGSDPTIAIRGHIASKEGTNNPLILLDNVEIPSIQLVNPDDVESISVLKDAASSSIYGSKAAFGVILITTKKGGGKKGKFNVTYSNNFSWQNPAKDINMGGLNALEYTVAAQENRNASMPAGGFFRVDRESLEKARQWQQKYGGTVKSGDPVLYGRDWYFDGKEKYGYRTYDAADAMIENWTPTMQHNLSAGGSSDKINYNIGLGYLKQTGMNKAAKVDDLKRYNASINLSSDINKYITVRAGALYSDRNKRYPGTGVTAADPWLYLYRWAPIFPAGVKEHGNDLRDAVYEMGYANTDNRQNKYYNINLGATLNITSNWDVQFDYTYVRHTEEINSSYAQPTAGQMWYAPVEWVNDSGFPYHVDEDGNVVDTGGIPAYRFPVQSYFPYGISDTFLQYSSKNTDQNTFNVYSTYNLKLGEEGVHAFKFMLGSNRETKADTFHEFKKTGLLDDKNPQFPLAEGQVTHPINPILGKLEEAQVGFFGRVNYGFDNKYLLEANLRYDGTSKFPKHLQWRWYPSFSGGWVLSNESFMKIVDPIWSFAKIRASWGSIGDQSVPGNLYRSTLAAARLPWIGADGSQSLGFGTPKVVQDNITWQKIETLDIGFDFRFWKNKLGVSFDWYQRDTKNLLIGGETLPVTLGDNSAIGNFGDLRTKGWEITVDFNHRFSNGLGINAMATLSDATTMITRAPDQNLPWENRSIKETNKWSTGRRFGDIYGYVTDRLYQKEDFVYDDNGKIQDVYIIYQGTSRKTNMQSGNNPIYQVEFEDGSNMIFAPGDTKYVDLDGDGYITSGDNTNGNPGDQKVIGNESPRYEYGIRLGADYKGFDISVFMQGVGKRKIWGKGQLALAGSNAKEGAMPNTFAKDFWREDRTDAFYPRPWDLAGNDGQFSMLKQSKYLLDMSYFRIKNITFGYTIPTKVLQKAYLSNARVYMSLENFFTFDNLRGLPIDPETVSGSSMFRADGQYNSGRTGMGSPTFKSLSFGLQLTF